MFVIALAAAIDRFAARSAEPARPTTQTAAQLRAAGVGGVLYFTDARCRMRALRLPSLRPVRPPETKGCTFALSPDARWNVPAGGVWHPRGRLLAVAHNGLVEVSSVDPVWGYRFERASAPAFKPDGTLTHVRDGDVVEWATECPPGSEIVTFLADDATQRCPRVVLTKRELAAGALRASTFLAALVRHGARLSVKETAWLDDDRLAAILAVDLRDGGREDVVAVYRGGKALGTAPGFGEPLSDLRVSPRGRFVAARGGRSGVVLLDRDGAEVSLQDLAQDKFGNALLGYVGAIAWSPDERWAAAATHRSVYFFPTGDPRPPMIRLRLVARDLAWR